MTHIEAWAARHAITPVALADLLATLANGAQFAPVAVPANVTSEAGVTSLVRLEASRKNVLLFRNQVGAFKNDAGQFVRFGLANDSTRQNEALKSGDWIGIRKILIQPHHVGNVLGQFVSREIKRAGWRYTGQGREVAQNSWNALITAWGGDACFAASEGTL